MAKKVVVYGTSACPDCHMVKDFLKEHGVEFEDINLNDHPEKVPELIEKTNGRQGVPVIIIDDEVVIGFDKEKISRLLEIKE